MRDNPMVESWLRKGGAKDKMKFYFATLSYQGVLT